ncbi:hypothetical protein [Coleofasciculus sp. F4-SAH-05]|uniref:hypothetical protein n=1 Tax=Coleofasciculus sp. F4-SAH-05 TaxID=3069525 RepID=UPI0033025DEA
MTTFSLLKLLPKTNVTDFRVCSKRFSASGTLRAYYEPNLSRMSLTGMLVGFDFAQPTLR